MTTQTELCYFLFPARYCRLCRLWNAKRRKTASKKEAYERIALQNSLWHIILKMVFNSSNRFNDDDGSRHVPMVSSKSCTEET
jgi:hypothetical protein